MTRPRSRSVDGPTLLEHAASRGALGGQPAPLADRMRPRTLDEIVGQASLLARGKPLREAIENDRMPSIVLWGPPGSGKTTIASVIAHRTKTEFVPFSAVLGGVAELVACGVPAGLGEPVFDKLKADLAKALFSLPAVLGVEYGSGFACATMRGSVHNDPFVPDPFVPDPGAAAHGAPGQSGRVPSARTTKNHHGGMLGGISSGMPIVLRAAIKPTSSLPRPQDTINRQGEATTVRTTGRHDPCLLPRFIPMGEAMVAIVLADHYLRQRSQLG